MIRVLVQLQPDAKLATSARFEKFCAFQANFLFLLAGRSGRLIAHDFTPPPYHASMIEMFNKNQMQFVKHSSGFSFQLASREHIGAALKQCTWTDVLVIRIVESEMTQLDVPVMEKRFGLNAPLKWFEKNVGQWKALCYLSTVGIPAIDILSTNLSLSQIASMIEYSVHASGGCACDSRLNMRIILDSDAPGSETPKTDVAGRGK